MAETGRKILSIFGEELGAESQDSQAESETASTSQRSQSNLSIHGGGFDNSGQRLSADAQSNALGADGSEESFSEERYSASEADSDIKSVSRENLKHESGRSQR